MKKKIYDLLIKNWYWKILAFIAACLFWYAYVNVQNPVATETVSQVPVQVLHYEEFLSKGKNIEFEDSSLNIDNLTLNVTIRGRTTLVKEMSEQKDRVFNVWIDFYELNNDDDRIIIHYEIAPAFRNLYSSVQFVSLYNQTYYEILIEEDQTKTLSLDYQIVGSPAEGYTYIEDDPAMMLTPTEITLTGPEVELAEIASAQILASVEGLKANTALPEPIMFYDADGNRVYPSNNITTSSDAATLYIPIYQVKTVPLKASIVGEVQEGYQYMEDATLSVDSVVIYGQESDLKDIKQLVLPDISLAEYTGRASEVFSLSDILASRYPNENVRYYSGSTSVRVTFTVAELLKHDFELPTKSIKVKGLGDRTLTYKSKNVTLSVEGVQEAIDAVNTNAIHMEIDLTGLEAGNHTVPISVYIMSTSIGQIPVTILNEDQFTVDVTIKDPEPEEESQEETAKESSESEKTEE